MVFIGIYIFFKLNNNCILLTYFVYIFLLSLYYMIYYRTINKTKAIEHKYFWYYQKDMFALMQDMLVFIIVDHLL